MYTGIEHNNCSASSRGNISTILTIHLAIIYTKESDDCDVKRLLFLNG